MECPECEGFGECQAEGCEDGIDVNTGENCDECQGGGMCPDCAGEGEI